MASALGFEVGASFLTLSPPGERRFDVTPVEKGVLAGCEILHLPADGQPDPTVTLQFVTTNLRMPHTEVLYWAGYPNGPHRQPIMSFNVPDGQLRYGAQYRLTNWLRPVLEVEVRLGVWAIDVAKHPAYTDLRRTVALACASAILARHEGKGALPIRLIVRDNFENPRLMRILAPVNATGVADLDERLAKASRES